jgi:hypothetical protein
VGGGLLLVRWAAASAMMVMVMECIEACVKFSAIEIELMVDVEWNRGYFLSAAT